MAFGGIFCFVENSVKNVTCVLTHNLNRGFTLAPMELNQRLTVKIVRLLEGIRRDEKMTVAEFVTHFEITETAYYKWIRFVNKKGVPPKIRMSVIERGLDSLGYETHVIIPKRKKR